MHTIRYSRPQEWRHILYFWILSRHALVPSRISAKTVSGGRWTGWRINTVGGRKSRGRPSISPRLHHPRHLGNLYGVWQVGGVNFRAFHRASFRRNWCIASQTVTILLLYLRTQISAPPPPSPRPGSSTGRLRKFQVYILKYVYMYTVRFFGPLSRRFAVTSASASTTHARGIVVHCH